MDSVKRNEKVVSTAIGLSMLMMFAYSISGNMYSTLVSSIIENFGLSKTVASSFTAASSICSMGVMLFMMIFGDRLNKGTMMGIVCSVYGVSMLILGAFTNFTLFFIDFTIVGVAGGFVDSMTGAHVSDLAGGSGRSRGIATLHTIFAVGAIISPNLAAYLLGVSGSFKMPYRIMGAVLLAVGIVMLLFTFHDPYLRTMHRSIAAAAGGEGKKFKLPVKEMLHSRRLVMLTFAVFFNTGSYYVFTMLTDYLHTGDSVLFPIAFCSIIHTCYNVGMLVSRSALSALGSRVNCAAFSSYGGIGCAVALTAALTIGSPAAWLICMSIVGIIGGANYTMRMILVCDEFPNNSASMMAIINIAASLANTVFYMVFGMIADNVSYALSMYLSVACYAIPAVFTFIGYGKDALPLFKKLK